jgi:hypothetical protein
MSKFLKLTATGRSGSGFVYINSDLITSVSDGRTEVIDDDDGFFAPEGFGTVVRMVNSVEWDVEETPDKIYRMINKVDKQ